MHGMRLEIPDMRLGAVAAARMTCIWYVVIPPDSPPTVSRPPELQSESYTSRPEAADVR